MDHFWPPTASPIFGSPIAEAVSWHMEAWGMDWGYGTWGALDHLDLVMGQNHGTLVNIKIAGKWMFIHPNMVL